MQYAPTIFTTYYCSRVGMLTIICVDTYAPSGTGRDLALLNLGLLMSTNDTRLSLKASNLIIT